MHNKSGNPPQSTQHNKTSKARLKPNTIQLPRRTWRILLIFIAALSLAIIIGAFAGHQSGMSALTNLQKSQTQLTLDEQFQLGLQDMEEQRYDIARQRFEYILSQDPSYPEASDRLTESLLALYATATPSPPAATQTPTPTVDMRPVQDLFANAKQLIAESDWDAAIDTLITLRKADPGYQVARVDGMLYLALRYRGLTKILNRGDLEGGQYDLSLAERFARLDIDAVNARNWARIYVIGLSFWEAIPEQAVYYFSQIASAAPYLRDASGWTARDRYRGALIQYGDQLAQAEDWCTALVQYELAMAIQVDAQLQVSYENALQMCIGGSETPDATLETPTPTITPDLTGTATIPSLTQYPPTDTPVPPPQATPSPTSTPTQENTPTPTPTETPTPQPNAGANTPTPQNTP